MCKGVKYSCDQWDYQATQKSNLIRHRQSKHDGVKYSCNQCDFEATQKRDLLDHTYLRHEGG